MQRSLIQLSPSTAVVSLPSAWVEHNKLKKGAKLTVDENENRIIISCNERKSTKEISIDISSMTKKLMWMSIDGAYTAGYDTIVIKTKDQEQTAYLTKVVRYFPGLIIEDERKNVVVFKDMVQDTKQEFDKLLARIFNSIVATFEDGIEAMKAKDWTLLADMKRRDYNINTYIALCLRHLSKYGHEQFSKTGIMHSYIKILEMISDKLCMLLVGAGQQRISGKAELETLSTMLGLFKQAYKLHFSYSQDLLISLEQRREKALAGLPKMDQHTHMYATEALELFFEIEELESALHI
jgi:phosphate uptake regulator